MIGVFLSLGLVIGHAADRASLQSKAKELNCQAAIEAESGNSLVCFRDEVMDLGMDTETKGCGVRLYDRASHSFFGFHTSKELKEVQEAGANLHSEDQLLLAPLSCEAGGLREILKWPADEFNSLEDYLKIAFAHVGPVNVISGGKAGQALVSLVSQINAANLKGIQAKPAKFKEAKSQPIAAPPNGAGRRESSKDEVFQYQTVEVLFGSDRQYVKNVSPGNSFSNARNSTDQLYLGKAEVSVPSGTAFASFDTSEVFNIQVAPDPEKNLILRSVDLLSPNDFWQQLVSRVEGSKKKDLFVFIHGYNYSFEQAALRTAQMALDFKISGTPIFYSWPSETVLRYAIAEKNIEWTLPRLTQFLKEITQKSGSTEIHLIAHSMGNRGLASALNRLALSNSHLASKKIRSVVMAAPDVDPSNFQEIKDSIASISERLTLYTSDHDKALEISARIHSRPRLGQAGPFLFTADGVDTIDASRAPTSAFGHSYFEDSQRVVNDLIELISKSLPPSSRPNLLPKTSHLNNKPYWELTPN